MKIGFVMDPIERINPVKDSTFAMLLEAQRRGHEIHYMTDSDLYVANHQPRAISRHLTLQDKTSDWFSKGPEEEIELARLEAKACWLSTTRRPCAMPMKSFLPNFSPTSAPIPVCHATRAFSRSLSSTTARPSSSQWMAWAGLPFSKPRQTTPTST